jgi:hypothetical protein
MQLQHARHVGRDRATGHQTYAGLGDGIGLIGEGRDKGVQIELQAAFDVGLRDATTSLRAGSALTLLALA